MNYAEATRYLISLGNEVRASSLDSAQAAKLGLENITTLLEDLGRPQDEYPSVLVSAEGREALRHGRDLSRGLVGSGFPEASPPERLRILDDSGALVALAVPRGFSNRAGELALEPVLHPDVVLVR